MPAKSKLSQSRKENRKKGSGRPPLKLCLPCSTRSPSLNNTKEINKDDDELQYICAGENNYLIFQKFSEINLDFREICEDEEDDEIVLFENNSLDYENELCEKLDSLLLEIDTINESLFVVEELYKGFTPQYGIRKGCGTSVRTMFYNKEHGSKSWLVWGWSSEQMLCTICSISPR